MVPTLGLALTLGIIPGLGPVVEMLDFGPRWVARTEGSGEPATTGDLVTLHLVAWDASGREVANTARRGLTYTLPAPDADPLSVWGAVLPGSRKGSTWEAEGLSFERLGFTEVPPFLPRGSRIRLEIRVIEIRRVETTTLPAGNAQRGSAAATPSP